MKTANSVSVAEISSFRGMLIALKSANRHLELIIVNRTDVASFFEPSINCIVQAILEQQEAVEQTISVRFSFEHPDQ
jgi:hypothetical protein